MGSRKCLEVFEGKAVSAPVGSISLNPVKLGQSVLPSYPPPPQPYTHMVLLRLKGLDKNL